MFKKGAEKYKTKWERKKLFFGGAKLAHAIAAYQGGEISNYKKVRFSTDRGPGELASKSWSTPDPAPFRQPEATSYISILACLFAFLNSRFFSYNWNKTSQCLRQCFRSKTFFLINQSINQSIKQIMNCPIRYIDSQKSLQPLLSTLSHWTHVKLQMNNSSTQN